MDCPTHECTCTEPVDRYSAWSPVIDKISSSIFISVYLYDLDFLRLGQTKKWQHFIKCGYGIGCNNRFAIAILIEFETYLKLAHFLISVVVAFPLLSIRDVPRLFHYILKRNRK